MTFPDNFIWGVAGAALQTEGYPRADGGGVSIWDTFSHTPGKVADDDNIDIACDSYHRYEEDIRLAAELGVSVYRFSISWARVDPLGNGSYNEKGLEYYDRVIDCILKYGLEPYITLYHWELPQAVQDRGGWANPGTPEAFAAYSGMIAQRYRGKVKYYITFNEIQCTVSLGNRVGLHAPGNTFGNDMLFPIWKGLVTAHGLAMRAVKAANPDAKVGFVSCGELCYPATESAADIEAARAATFTLTEDSWDFSHSMALDAICFGSFGMDPGLSSEEWDIIHCPPDFIGINVYNGHEVKAGENGEPAFVPKYRGFPRTALKWPVTPEVMNKGIQFIWDRYHIPIIITENGCSCNDRIYSDGKVHDADRIDFLEKYLGELSKCVESAHVQGFFHWSILDNFEWQSGYSERFGLIYVDYPTLKRIPKDSYYWFKNLIAK